MEPAKGLNPRPSDYKSDALPTELRRPARWDLQEKYTVALRGYRSQFLGDDHKRLKSIGKKRAAPRRNLRFIMLTHVLRNRCTFNSATIATGTGTSKWMSQPDRIGPPTLSNATDEYYLQPEQERRTRSLSEIGS